MTFEYFFLWVDQRPGLASWVQAFGAIISIWLAWWIARTQAKRIEYQAVKQDISRCSAVIQVLKHARQVFGYHMNMANDYHKIERFKTDLARIILIFNDINLFELPAAELVNAVCIVRQELEKIALDFTPSAYNSPEMLGIHFQFGLGKQAIECLDAQVAECEKALANIQMKSIPLLRLKAFMKNIFLLKRR